MASHTTTPWVLDGKTLRTADREGTHLAYLEEAPGLGHDALAVRALIAAAPDLLEALQAILAHEAHLLNPYRAQAARDAINKALV